MRFLACLLSLPALAFGDPVEILEPLAVRAGPLSIWSGEGTHPESFLRGDALRMQSALTLDEALQQVPGFRLFRRLDSRSAHPTTQGVSLRNTGASASSRTLVLVDGIPANDPFGGWIPWTRIPGPALQGASLLRHGGVSPGGWNSMGGEVEALTRFYDERFSLFTASAGSHLDLDSGWYAAQPVHRDLQVHGGIRAVEYPGHFVLPADTRGAVDRRAGFDAIWSRAGMEWTMPNAQTLRAHATYAEEDRRNGSAQSRNDTDGVDAEASWRRESGAWTLYLQEREFANRFSSVNEDRSEERAVLDQYSVPSRALGLIGRERRSRGDHDFGFGGDLRHTEGHTHERFRNLGRGFTRERRAGGESMQAGVFVNDRWRPNPVLEVEAGFRTDYHRSMDGLRREQTLGGEVLRDEDLEDRDSWEPAGRLAARIRTGETVSFRGAVFTGNRYPSLNEFHRPFRVGNDITEANPDLDPERLYGADLGVRIAGKRFEFNLDGFVNRIEDQVANVTLVEGPFTGAPFGFVPAGGSGRQRQNLEQVRVAGCELQAGFEAAPGVTVEAAWLFSHSEVRDEALRGLQLAQTPEHSASMGVHWSPWNNWQFGAYAQYRGSQFEDDLNQRKLEDAVTVDLAGTWRITEELSLQVEVENLGDEAVAFREDGDGLTFIGPGRSVTAGIRVMW